jgi:hypothetical protein
MSVGFDPKQTYSLSLDFYADFPAETRPAFVYRRISGREYSEIVKANGEHTKAIESGQADGGVDHVYEALRVGLVDWKNQTCPENGEPVPFDASRLNEIIDPVEGMELVSKRLYAARLNGKELKNSG